MTKVNLIKNKLAALNLLIGFAHTIPPSPSVQFTDTKFGKQAIGSPLPFQLAAADVNFSVHHNLSAISDCGLHLKLSILFKVMEVEDLALKCASLGEE